MASQLTRRVLRVFLASPSDVGEERILTEKIAGEVNKIVGRRLQWQIDFLKWEDKGPGVGRPQSIINPDVDECDLFVGLLWEHWGHPTGAYSSGFEEEFERAKARNQRTGEPQIWLVFKEPRSDKLTDPGPQLSAVLAFKERQIAANEVLFYRVKDKNEWERFLFCRLTEHVLDLSQSELSARQQGVATSSPAAQSAESREALEPEDLLTGSKGQVLRQVKQGYQVLGRLIESKQLEFGLGEEKLLKEFDVARLHLLTTTWVSKRYTGETLGNHEINQLYRHRSGLETAPPETFLLLRTLISDSDDAVPGWFWFRGLTIEKLAFLLFGLANGDTLASLRMQAIRVLKLAEIEPADDRWDLLPLADVDVRVRWAAHEYLEDLGNLTVLPVLEKALRDDTDSDTYRTAYRTRLHILARLDPDQGFLGLIAKPDYASDKLLRVFQTSVSKIKTATLNQGFASPSNEIRELSAMALAKRGELSIADAEKLTKDLYIPIRKIGFEELIKRGKVPDLNEIKKAFAEDQPGSQLGRRRRFSDFFYRLTSPSQPDYSELANSVILALLRTFSREELLKRVDWLEVHGATAYRCLVSEHYDVASAFVRTDIKEGFQRIRNATFEQIKAQYGAEAVERLSEKIERLEQYIRDQFLEAALVGLTAHAEDADLEMARNHLSHTSAGVKGAALEIVCRLGTADDVPALIAISNEAGGEFRAKAAACALRLSKAPFEVAKAFASSRTPEIVSIGFRWLLEDNSTQTRQFFDNLLSDESETHRERAIQYMTKGLAEPAMQKLLEDYLTRESYYYNVVTWLDRFLYAATPLRDMYKRQLEAKNLTPRK